jgi:hypothetical protein
VCFPRAGAAMREYGEIEAIEQVFHRGRD